MENYYLIDGRLCFYPVTNVLKPLDDSIAEVVLSKPASRCFLLLIERQGEVVSHDDFINEVWGKKGIVVTRNTYYQSISILRKRLKALGFDDDVIVTLPRKGLMLSEEVAVIKQNNLNPESVSAEAEEASVPGGDAMTSSSLPGDNQQALLHASETEKSNSQSWLLNVKARYGGVIIAAIVCALVVAAYLTL
ncbi:winged helix-turn-helix domain-containing protein [Pantoea piersonii]|uniref:winged helix-turn-helix domain-containing protein n=1 Tax=Pantoea piersonii TaxID=2364647 RepID=UPI0028AC094E|nr:winged helix-turn-helix domain-containing protein [Pantoea piersonii]